MLPGRVAAQDPLRMSSGSPCVSGSGVHVPSGAGEGPPWEDPEEPSKQQRVSDLLCRMTGFWLMLPCRAQMLPSMAQSGGSLTPVKHTTYVNEPVTGGEIICNNNYDRMVSENSVPKYHGDTGHKELLDSTFNPSDRYPRDSAVCTGGIEHVDGQFAWTADGRGSTIVLERYNSSGYSVSDIAGNGLGENVTAVSRSPHSSAPWPRAAVLRIWLSMCSGAPAPTCSASGVISRSLPPTA